MKCDYGMSVNLDERRKEADGQVNPNVRDVSNTARKYVIPVHLKCRKLMAVVPRGNSMSADDT